MIPGLQERDAPKRHLATAILMPIALVCLLGFILMVYALPFWVSLPVGLVLIAAGFALSLFIVDRMVGKKVKPPYNRFGDE